MYSLKAAFSKWSRLITVFQKSLKSLILQQLFEFVCAILPRKFKKIKNETYFDNFQTPCHQMYENG